MPKEHATVKLITIKQIGFEGLSEDVDGLCSRHKEYRCTAQRDTHPACAAALPRHPLFSGSL